MTDWDIYGRQQFDPETDVTHFVEQKSEPVALSDLTGTTQTYQGPIIMRSRAIESYYNLARSYVEVEFNLQRATGAAMDATDVAALINSAWHLFSHARLTIGGYCVGDVHNPGKVHLWKSLASYGVGDYAACEDNEFLYLDAMKYRKSGPLIANVGEERYQALGYAQPVDILGFQGSIVDARPNGIDGVVGVSLLEMSRKDVDLRYNEAFAARFFRCKNSKAVRVLLPLRNIFGYAELNKPIHGLQVQLELTKSLDYPHIIHSTADTPAMQTILRTASLWLADVVPSRPILLDTEIAYQSASARMTYNDYTAYSSPIYSSATTRVDVDFGIVYSRPLWAIVGIMSELQYGSQQDHVYTLNSTLDLALARTTQNATADTDRTGSRHQNNCANGAMTSHLNDISRVTVKINNKAFPQEEYTSAFVGENGVTRCYYDFLKLFGRDKPDAQKALAFAEWSEMPLFGFTFDESINGQPGGGAYSVHIETLARSSPLGVVSAAGSNGYAAGGPGSYRLYCLLCTEKGVTVSANGGFFKIQ